MRIGLAQELAQLCPGCGPNVANIKDDEFSCHGGLTKQIIYRARMVGTDTYSAPGLVSLMQSWVGSGRASIMVQSSRLHLDPTCGTSLDTLQSSVCPLGEQPLLTSPSIGFTQMTSSPGSDSESAAQAGAIAGSISAVVVVILAIFSALLILVLAMKTLNSKQ